MLQTLLGWTDGKKTILAGIGLIGLGTYELSQGQTDQALGHLAQGLAALGLRRAITVATK